MKRVARYLYPVVGSTRPGPAVHLLDPQNELVISVASAWEITVKPELGIYDVAEWFRTAARKLQARILPVQLDHIAVLGTLRSIHKDPFDRMLIA